MSLNFYALLFRPNAKLISLIALVIFLFSYSSVKAQRRSSDGDGYGVALSTGYDVPVGNLSYTFKPAQNYTFTALSYHDNWTTSISFGYHSYKPKQDTFYYQVDQNNFGTIQYQNFTAYSIYLGAAYNVNLATGLRVYGGINFGAYYTHMVYHSVDEFTDASSDQHEENIYFAPKFGINYSISENISIGIEGKYNTFVVAGNKSDNPDVGTISSSYAGSLVLTYNF